MNKAIFLDRDGTLNEDEGYVYKVEDFRLHQGVIEGLRLLKDFKLFIVTNQSGIGRGYYTEQQMHKFNQHLVKELSADGINIQKIYYCPHTPEERCDCRKPSTTFIIKARKDYKLDLSKSWVIGDHPCDIIMAHEAGCRSVFVLTGHGKKHLAEVKKNSSFIAKDLLEAARHIIKNEE